MLACSGCSTVTHKQAKANAQQRWKHVRANIKQRLAQQQYASGRFEEAARSSAEAIALDTQFVASYDLLARSYVELGKATSAMRILRAAESKGLDSSQLHYTRGIVLENQGLFDEALVAYSKAIELEPGNVAFRSAQAECLATNGQATEALEVLGDAREPMDDDGAVALLRAHIVGLKGDEAKTVRLLRDAHAKSPENALIREELGRTLATMGHCAESMSLLTPLIDEPIDDAMNGAVRRAMATCYLDLNDPHSALAMLKPYAETHHTDASAQLLLAKAALGTNDMLTAMRAIYLAAQQETGRAEILLVRAAIRWKRGNLKAATTDLRNVLAANPTDVEAHCLLGEVLATQRDTDAARSQFQLALQLEPNNAWADAGLASLAETMNTTTSQQ